MTTPTHIDPIDFIRGAIKDGHSTQAAARAHVASINGREVPVFIGILASTKPRTGAEKWATTKSYDPIQRFKTVTLAAGPTDPSHKIRTAALHKALGEGKVGVREVFCELADPSYATSSTNPTYRQALADFGAATLARERIDLDRSAKADGRGEAR